MKSIRCAVAARVSTGLRRNLRCGSGVLSGLLLVAALSACHRNVIFNSAQEPTVVAGSPDQVSLYFDRYGDVYPNDPKMVDMMSSLRGAPSLCVALHRSKLDSDDADLNARLEQYRAVATADLVDCYGKPSSAALVQAWDRVQSRIWSDQLQSIRKKLAAGGEAGGHTQVLLLIHGFNTTQVEAKDNYDLAIKKFRFLGHDLSRTLVIQIYWDGLKAKILAPPWAKAQYRAPLVGLSLRRLLNELPTDVTVLALTHSSGGIVAASMVGDASGAFPFRNQLPENCPSQESPYCRYSQANALPPANRSPAELRIPKPRDVRIGMLAAATPSNSFFYRGCSSLGVQSPNTTLIFGMNPDDGVVTKGYFGLDQVSLLGATTMATGGEDFDRFREVRDGLQQGRSVPVTVYGIHFTDAPGHRTYGPLWRGQSHDFGEYLERPAFVDFAKLLLEGDGCGAVDARGLCAGAPAKAGEKAL